MTNVVQRVLSAGLIASFCGVGFASMDLADNYDSNYTQKQLHQMVRDGVISPQQDSAINQRLEYGWQSMNNNDQCHHSSQQSQARNYHKMLQAQWHAQQMGLNGNGNYANGNYANAYGMPTYGTANSIYGDYSNGMYSANNPYNNGPYNNSQFSGNNPYNANYSPDGYGYSPYNNNGGGFGGMNSVVGNILNSNGGQYSTPLYGNGGGGITSSLQNFLQNH